MRLRLPVIGSLTRQRDTKESSPGVMYLAAWGSSRDDGCRQQLLSTCLVRVELLLPGRTNTGLRGAENNPQLSATHLSQF